jgi:hypothetical protein
MLSYPKRLTTPGDKQQPREQIDLSRGRFLFVSVALTQMGCLAGIKPYLISYFNLEL